MQQMWHVRGSQSPLPYAIFITKILEHFGVSLDGETKVALNLRERKVDIEVVHKMGFVIDPVTRRTYKHRTDRQTAPTDEPEPTAPNQPKSHAPSSSSAAMPTNQMIMDELVSLRGYITTRMDAFDTQSQQICYELHRLSSRLSNMDVDEDSSELDYITPKERGSILKTSQDISSSMLLSENYTFKKILLCHHQKRGDCEEDLAPDRGTGLMKTPTSQKEERKKTYKDYRRQSFKELESKSLGRLRIEYGSIGYDMIGYDRRVRHTTRLSLEREGLSQARVLEFLSGFYLEASPKRDKARLGESGSPGGVEYWAILKDSRRSEIWLAWARKSCRH
ncbi:hypothetical protein Lal_00015603 [Lupinus albus]|nr:hypothetical protein Lal_00015603 [Lupinus albus]